MSEDDSADSEDDWFETAIDESTGNDDPEEDPFDESFGETFGGEAGPDPDSGTGPGSGDPGRGGAFGGGAGPGAGSPGGDAFGAGDEDLFDEDFASAFESAGGGEFDDEDFESDIPRIELGIEGLDNMVQGGIPERHLLVTVGAPGTGKTTFGLQFLDHGLAKLDEPGEEPEKAVFITLEQSYDDIIATAEEHNWAFTRYEEEDLLTVVDLDPVEMANSLENIRAELPELIKGFGADRLVLDSVSLLEMMYDEQAKRRTEVFDFTRSLKAAGVTTMLTSEASGDNPYASRHGIIEYLTDAVVLLRYVRQETRETRLAVEIQKIRNANHSRETKPYEITDEGISVYQQANIF